MDPSTSAAGSTTYPITGVPLVSGQPLPLRQEITAWVEEPKNKRQVSLFLRALRAIKEMPIEDKTSFFQLAGLQDRSDKSITNY